MLFNKIRYSVLLRIISVLLINAFFLSGIAWAGPINSNSNHSLSRWTATQDPVTKTLAKLMELQAQGVTEINIINDMVNPPRVIPNYKIEHAIEQAEISQLSLKDGKFHLFGGGTAPVSQAVLAKCEDLQEAVKRGNDDVAIALCRELSEYCATHRDVLKKTPIVKEKVVPALLATLRVGGREGSSVRAPAIGALGATAGYIKDELELIEKVVRALMKRVFIGDPLEQPAARGALVRFKRSAIPFLTDELDNEKNRKFALQTLVEMGKPAVDPLFTYLKDSKWELQLAVAQDLFSIDRSGGDNNVSLFIENLALLGFLTPISSEKLALYNNSPYNKCPHMKVRIEENVDKAGDAFAAEILDGLQFWFEKLKIDRHPERRVGIQLCTGDSPFGGYRKVGGDAFMESLQDTNRYDPEKIRELREQYKRVAGILDSWETPRTQAFLREHGLDSRLKPDMSKVTAFAVDAIFPQRSFDDKNADYFAFAHLLNNVCDLWGIPEENRNFFHGDVHVTQKDGEWRTEGIDDAEYAKIVESVDKEGLKMLEFQAACLLAGEKNGFSFNTPLRVKQGKVVGYVLRRDNENEDFRVEQVEIEPLKPEHAQYGYLQDMRNQAIMMHEKLVEFGGAHITLLGLGPSSDGKGHIGFCEEGTPPEQTCFISEIHDYDATFHVSGAHAKEVYGFKNMFVTVDGVRRPRFGFITYAPFEFMYRGSRPRTGFTKRNIENEVKVIVIATGNAKSHSIVKAIEGEIDPNFPLSYVQRSRGVFVLDRAAARELAIFRNSWEFHRFPKTSWTMENIRRYFIEFAQLLKCKLAAIDYKAPIAIDSWRRQLGQASEGMRQIIKNRLRNIINLIGFVYETEGKPLKKAQDVINDIESCVIRPGEIMKKLEERWGLKRGDKILADSPHMDDEFLAMMHPLKVLAENCPISAYYNSYGYTAVYSEYVLALLDIASQFSGEEMMALSDDTREELFRALVDEQHTFKPIPHLDYEVLPYMSEREKMLRAKILLLDLNERRDIKDENDRKRAKNKFRTPEQVKQLGNFLAEVNSRKPRNGGKDLDIMCYAKTSIRYMEAASALMYLGISFSEVHWPLDIAYGDLGRGQTLSRKDINKIKKVIGEEPPGGPPKAIIFNGEGFPDFGGHSNTEMGVYIALFELLEEGKISPDILLIQWAGVWDRISVESSHLSVVLTAEELRDFADSFTYFYRGQAPYAPVLNASSAEPQSFANDVIEASRASVQEMLSLVDLSPDLRDILNRGGGILHYKVRKLSDPAVRHEFRMKTEELLKAGLGTSLSSSKSLMGDQPYPERLHELPGELVDKMLAAEAISEKEKKLFEGKNSPRIATNSVSDISGKASGGIKIDVDQSLSLLNKYIPAKLKKGEVYEIRYNKTKFDEYQMNAGLSAKKNSPRALLQEYIDLLRVRAPKGSIKIIPCSRDDRPLISVSRYASKDSAEPLGEGSVNMKGDIRGQPLRIIGMLNMAFAASHIPNDASPAEMHKYTSLLDLIKNQYKSITGKELTAENLLKAIRRITLQATKPIPVQILEEYYRLTIEQLREAA